MKLFDTPSQQYVDFQPDSTVKIYTCGITPYDSAHLGHIFTFLTYDLLQRRLEDKGLEVQLVRNITDVDEPIYRKAAQMGIAYTELAAQETALFKSVLKDLNFRPAFAEPLASEYIQPMAEAVQKLLEAGIAYKLDDDIYFDTSQDDEFGKFCNFSSQLQLSFMHRRGGDPERVGKRNPLDFLLWRGISDESDPAAWDSVVGRGRPGWHIECTVMAAELLGAPFDIHGGGDDLIFPHHECENAQSRSLGQSKLAKYWLHVAPILYAGDKMSKSIGNLVFAKDILKDFPAPVIRLSLLKYHYRTGGEWQPEFLLEADELFKKLESAKINCTSVAAESLLSDIRGALDDDLDSHLIMHALNDFVTSSPKTDENDSGEVSVFKVYKLLGLIN